MSQDNCEASCGLDLCNVSEISSALKSATQNRYEFICLPLVHPRFKREFSLKCNNRPGPFTRPDLTLPSSDWNSFIVGKISPYIDVDSDVEAVRRQSEQALEQELGYAYHLGVPAVLIKLHGLKSTNLARILYSYILGITLYQIWIQVPMVAPKVRASFWRSDYEENEKCDADESTWEWWNKFRSLCSFEKRIGIVLEVSADLPSQQELDRWCGEPVKCLLLSTSIFLTNRKGYPVLSKQHQAFVKSMALLDVQIIIKGHTRHDNLSNYQKYINHLWQEVNYVVDPVTNFGRGYEDCLQCPLQPLMNNLESHTYEVFEKDPVKYNEYMRAIYCALIDNIKVEEKETKVMTVMVVGAGRGPLVIAALNAAYKADRKIKVYAVEKNPNAVVTLQAHQEEMWRDQVTVVSCDMREFNPPEKADILVSELLGSFSDNELSPECLDGAQKFLKDGGISIPKSYTSYICPVQTSKIYNEVRNMKGKDSHPLAQFEKPYVVLQKNKYIIARNQPLFTFHHPNYDNPIDNTRYKCLTFEVEQDCVLHGFSGFFDTVLYKDIMLSIVPETYSNGMFSWFPIFFPISQPVQLKAGDEIELHFWRMVSKTNVWYEWTITKPVPLHVHNPSGRSYKIGLG
ncbi:UNVERIFIED_CONTAM: hypothetical protein PYX00_004944 [Menopon gallinae]|uniref:Protein arginine N-methyltransferase n=1 Tax=Menopon gallinae TaxID=328185 RepID=A0AAW2I6H7_9NEOP